MTTHWQIHADRPADIPVAVTVVDRLIPGTSPRMQHLKRLIELVAPSDAPALILGETGVGKELAALAVHRLSGRKGEFVAINCAAIPAELLEGELFGHEKGAFTGADRARSGLIEQARGGTLFLDEIGDMPLAMQAKLLRVLETRSVRRIGGNASVDVDFRLVAATHRGLPEMAEMGAFRLDLFYRLAVFTLEVPSLAERPGDLPIIVDRLLSDMFPLGQSLLRPRFDQSALRALAAHRWKGNIRELRAIVQRAAALFPGQDISAQAVEHNLIKFAPPGMGAGSGLATARPTFATGPDDFDSAFSKQGILDLRIHIRDIEISAIEAALRHARGCVSRAADALRLRRTTLIEKMKKYGIPAEA